ncbi:MAG: hypothetical protein K6C94_00825 [Candidatus Gastranaerophilales bacterium]|nr:hypothetical protein [Candidatus Gastranaerophilales bacterium]
MGLSASQSRFLQLTARRNDNEYEAQQINHARSAIAEKMQQISTKYSEGINNRRLMFLTPVGDGSNAVNSVRLTYDTITAAYPEGLGYKLVTKNGVEIRPGDQASQVMLKFAEQALDLAQNTKVLTFNSVDADGNATATEINGANFKELLQNYTILSNGEPVNRYTMAEEVQGMDELNFGKYFAQHGMSLQAFGNVPANQSVTMDYCQDAIEMAQAEVDEAKAIIEASQTEAYHYDDRCMDSEYLQQQLRLGEWTLQRVEYNDTDLSGEPKKVNVFYGSLSTVADELDTDDDNAYISEYKAQMDYYQHKDKQLELELQRLQTSHNAIQTEIDSVKKVIDTNVEKSFKTFG